MSLHKIWTNPKPPLVVSRYQLCPTIRLEFHLLLILISPRLKRLLLVSALMASQFQNFWMNTAHSQSFSTMTAQSTNGHSHAKKFYCRFPSLKKRPFCKPCLMLFGSLLHPRSLCRHFVFRPRQFRRNRP